MMTIKSMEHRSSFRRNRIVIKLGGSLFRDPMCLADIRDWIRRLPLCGTDYWIVVGGGAAVDQVRVRQKEEAFSDLEAHWLAIEAMRTNAEEFARDFELQLQPVDTSWIRERQTIGTDCPSRGCVTVVSLLNSVLAVPDLPATWETTSDAIALWFTDQIRADSLFMAKRANPLEPVVSSCKMRGLDWVDPQFFRLWESWQDGRNRRLPKIWIRHFPVIAPTETTQTGGFSADKCVSRVAARRWTLAQLDNMGQ